MIIDQKNLQVPRKSARDHGYTAVRAAISAIPVAGGPAVELFAVIVRPPIERRRNEWMEAVSEALRLLEMNQKIDSSSMPCLKPRESHYEPLTPRNWLLYAMLL